MGINVYVRSGLSRLPKVHEALVTPNQHASNIHACAQCEEKLRDGPLAPACALDKPES